jgi:hypothetical protein
MKDVSKLESGHTVGQLHEDTAYGLKKFVNEKSLKAELHVRKEKISETLVMDADGNAEQKKIKTKSREPSTKDISDLIPVFRTKQERDEYHKAFADWYAQDGVAAQMKPAADAGKEMKNIFKQKLAKQKEKESALLKNVQKKALKAYKWFIGGNNYCADVFEIRKDDKRYPKLAGTWQIEIMSNYMATLKNGTPMWRGKHPTAKRIMQLKTNDVVRAQWNKNEEIPAGIRDSVLQKCNLERKDVIEMNFRVKKLDGGTVTLRPDFIAKEGEKVEKKDGTGSYTNTDNKSWRATAESLKEHKARKVFISPIGELK